MSPADLQGPYSPYVSLAQLLHIRLTVTEALAVSFRGAVCVSRTELRTTGNASGRTTGSKAGCPEVPTRVISRKRRAFFRDVPTENGQTSGGPDRRMLASYGPDTYVYREFRHELVRVGGMVLDICPQKPSTAPFVVMVKR